MFKKSSFSLSKSVSDQIKIRCILLSYLRKYLLFSWKLSWCLLYWIGLSGDLLRNITIYIRVLSVWHHLRLSILLLICVSLNLRRLIKRHRLTHRWLNLHRLTHLTLQLLTYWWHALHRLTHWHHSLIGVLGRWYLGLLALHL